MVALSLAKGSPPSYRLTWLPRGMLASGEYRGTGDVYGHLRNVYGHSLNVYGHSILCTSGIFTSALFLNLLSWERTKYIDPRYKNRVSVDIKRASVDITQVSVDVTRGTSHQRRRHC
jgi:hypothetical protein